MRRQQRQERSSKEIMGSAYHESGHAVAALTLGVPLGDKGISVSRYELITPVPYGIPVLISFVAATRERSGATRAIAY